MIDFLKHPHNIYIPIFILTAFLLAMAFRRYIYAIFMRISITFKAVLAVLGPNKIKDVESLNQVLKEFGYVYDEQQNIFYSTLNPWQKEFGYCRLYDESAASMGMIIHCEPIYFEYENKKWLVEFWKGQYDMTTGCELGVYNTTRPDLNILGVFNGTLYDSASEEDYIKASYFLRKDGKNLFARKGLHWWITGFVLGEFSEPDELKMYIYISLKSREMRKAFEKGLVQAGYSNNEFVAFGNSVSFTFDKPHTKQPLTQLEVTNELIQKKNKFLCEEYQKITKGCTTMEEKLKAVQSASSDIYSHIISLGRPKGVYALFDTIKKSL